MPQDTNRTPTVASPTQGPGLCRYDHVITAVRALQGYATQCANDVNTVEYLDQVDTAVRDLRAIESRISSDHEGERRSASSKDTSAAHTAIKQIKDIHAKLEPQITAAGVFLKQYGPGIAGIRNIEKAIRGVEGILDAGMKLQSMIQLMTPEGKAVCEI